MGDPKVYVQTDDHGVMRVGETGISLDSVVIAFQQGHDAETIQREYPGLSLEQVYGAIAYYLGHQDEVDKYLERQQKVWDELRAKIEATPSPVVERLRALKRNSTREPQ